MKNKLKIETVNLEEFVLDIMTKENTRRVNVNLVENLDGKLFWEIAPVKTKSKIKSIYVGKKDENKNRKIQTNKKAKQK